jgi:hypothetical protein
MKWAKAVFYFKKFNILVSQSKEPNGPVFESRLGHGNSPTPMSRFIGVCCIM